VLVARDQRDVEMRGSSREMRETVLARERRVFPAERREQRGDALEVRRPNGDVDVVVGACDRANVKVDRVATEQPIRQRSSLEGVVKLSDERQARVHRASIYHGGAVDT
jgi:hypothetical protein